MRGNGLLLPHVVPPKWLKGFPGANRVTPKTARPGGGLRARWRGPDGMIYEWDYQHGAVEVYDRNGKHLGQYDPVTGQRTGRAVPRRTVEP